MIIDDIVNEFKNRYKIYQSINIDWGSSDITRTDFLISNNERELFDVDFVNEKQLKKAILKNIDNFVIEQCMQVYLEYDSSERARRELEKFYPIEKENVKEFCHKFNSIAKYWEISVDIDDNIVDSGGWQFLEFPHYSLKKSAIEQLKNELTNKEDDIMGEYLKKEAIDEIMKILNDIKEIKNFVGKYGIIWHSDCWVAVEPINHSYENILEWEEKDFQNIDTTDIYAFNLGGSISTCEWELFGKYESTSEELEQAKANFLNSLLSKKSYYTKYFDLEFFDSELEQNCGWEHFMGIKAIIKPNAIQPNTKIKTEKLIQQIRNEEDVILELSASPLYDNPKSNFHKDSGLVPNGEFAYMLEFFSDLIGYDEETYQGAFGLNSRYIKDAMKLITKVENRAKEIEEKYADKGVKVTINGMNDGCEYGMAVYVWIPYQ